MVVPEATRSGFFFNDTATTEIYTLSLHDALPISEVSGSNTPEVVLAVLEMFVVREESTFTTRVTDLLELGRAHVRTPPTTPARRLPPPGAETNLVPAGIASDRLTPVASNGPVFLL